MASLIPVVSFMADADCSLDVALAISRDDALNIDWGSGCRDGVTNGGMAGTCTGCTTDAIDAAAGVGGS